LFGFNTKIMNSGVVITAIILILICVLPIFLVGSNTRKKSKKILKDMNDLAAKAGGKISEYDLWNGAGIGIDNGTQKLFFVREIKDVNDFVTINLKDIQKCRMLKTNHSLEKNVNEYPSIQKLELCFTYIDTQMSEIICPFYLSEQANLDVNQQQKLVEKWAGIVNTAILGKKNSK
jgi:hypothetical protein